MNFRRNFYWNNFYSKFSLSDESSFARFSVKYFKKNSSLLDVACGNGRDTFFFIKKGIKCKGIDISKIAIKNNSKKLKNIFEVKDVLDKFKIRKNTIIFIVGSSYTLLIKNQKKFFLGTLKKL